VLEVLKNKDNNETNYKIEMFDVDFKKKYQHTALLSRRTGLFKSSYKIDKLKTFSNEYFNPLHKSIQCHISIN
tara:strand:+ start:86 stop:304 length:219 start_codon:yes stop_codon:yes gene_type:complete